MYYIGIDLGGTNIAGGIVDQNGQIVYKKSIPTGSDRGVKAVIADMASLCDMLCLEYGVNKSAVSAVGIGVPGVVDRNTGAIFFSNNLGWDELPIRGMLADAIGLTVYMENDASVAGIAEYAAGVSKGTKNSLFITLGTGVGGGVIIDGKLFSGAHGAGTELGHFPFAIDGEECSCGLRGCWENYASATALIRMGREAVEKHPESKILEIAGSPEKINALTIEKAAKAGDIPAKEVFDRYCYYVAMGIAGLINIFDPEIVAIGGGVSGAGDYLLEPVRKIVREHTVAMSEETRPRIEIAKLGNDAGIIGAAMLPQLA